MSFEKEEVNDMTEEIIEKINDAVVKKRILIKNWKIGHSRWWDKNCINKKTEARKALRSWKRGLGEREEYSRKKKIYRSVCEEKKRKLQVKEEEEIAKIKGERQAWAYINRERKRRIGITTDISIEN